MDYCESTHSSLTSAASSSPYQTPSPRTSMSFEERHAQIAYPADASTKVLYAEPQPIYHSPGYINEDNQWSSPAISEQCAPAYLPEIYSHSKHPLLADSRRSEVPRGLMQQTEWSEVGPFNLPPYSQQPPAYMQSQQQMYASTLVGVPDLPVETRGRFGYSEGMMYSESMPPPMAPGLEEVYPDPGSVLGAPIKSEPASAVVVPTQSPYYSRPPSVASSLSSGQVSAHHIVHVVFTDDAASKETQYLRRRCHNCQQVEPPSWRRSHLVPGKIVCNRCGLYERTHLRPRPHRFDEVRTGNKGRKPTKQSDSKQGSPQPPVTQFTVKQEVVPVDIDLDSRRGSVASSLSGSASSHGEWEDSNYNTSLVAGNGSRLSPSQQHSPSHEGGVHRGANHFVDSSLAARFRAGRKSATAPYDAFSATRMGGPPTPPLVPSDGPGLFDPTQSAEGAYTSTPPLRRHTLGSDVAEISGWSTLPADFSSNILQNQPPVVSNIAY